MGNGLPEIPAEERTPTVLALLDIIQQQHLQIQQLRDEIAILKGLKPRPPIKPSQLEQPAPGQNKQDGESTNQKRPGSQKRPKNSKLTIHREVKLQVLDAPAGSVSLGYEGYIVQELVFEPRVTRYWRERIRMPDGRTLLAALPDEVLPGLHFGPTLISFMHHQYHHNHVTQPLLREQLCQLGFDISSGQVNRILTEMADKFHQEKEELLPAGLCASTYVGVDDTGARHEGRNGYCTYIGNDLFAYFESTATKSRLNFLEILRRPNTDYVINDAASTYWRGQGLSVGLQDKLMVGPQCFPDAAAWQRRLAELDITGPRHVRIATEGALLGSLSAQGVSPALVVLSDGARQFDVLVHAACWIHAERPLARMIPCTEEHRVCIEKLRQQIWELYQELKAYRACPEPQNAPRLTALFEALVEQRTVFPSINHVLKEMREHRAELLRVLERPEVPLHNNLSESHVRDYVKKRKISGSTRSDLGRRCRDTFASLKKTCFCLGVRFWDYLVDRIRGLGRIGRLVDLIREQAAAKNAAAGIAQPTPT